MSAEKYKTDHGMKNPPADFNQSAIDIHVPLSECTMDEALDCIGWGWSRATVYLLTAWSLFTNAICGGSISIIGHRVDAMWGYKHVAGRFLGPVFFTGSAIACTFMGYVSDRFGRRKPLMFSQALFTIGMAFIAVSQNVYMIFPASLIAGMGTPVGEMAQLIKAEYATGKVRDLELASWMISWPLGIMTTTALAVYAFPKDSQWWIYATAMTSIFAATIAIQFFLIPESPRFHFSRGRINKANTKLVRMKQRFPSWIKKSSPEDKKLGFTLKEIAKVQSAPFKVLFTRRLLPRSIALWVSLFTLTGSYYSSVMSYPSSHAELFYLSAVEIPSNFFFLILGRLIGRTWTLILAFAVLTLLFGLTAGLSFGEWIQYPARFVVSGLFNLVWLFIPDIYSSAERGMASTIASAIARPAAIILPLVSSYFPKRSFGITLAVLTALSGVLCAFFIPDMIGKELIDHETTTETGFEETNKEECHSALGE